LIRTVTPATVDEGLAIAPLGSEQWVLSITVTGGGSDGCDTPTLVGFQPSGPTLVAEIARSPTSPNTICAVTSAVTFYVALDRSVVTPAILQIGLTSNCSNAACSVPVPRR
jgi:hypothetical protein